MSEWSDWYVYRVDGPPMGPFSARAIADAILAGRLPPDCWVCPPAGPRWLRAMAVPVIATLIEAVPTRRRASHTRMVTAPMPSTPTMARDRSEPARPDLVDGTTRTPEPDPSPEPPTMRSGPPRGPDGFPIPPPPPSSSSPTPPSGYRASDTLESPFDEPPRKKTLGAGE